MEGMARQRELKRFRVKIAVSDSEHNELAVADLKGEVINDVPQVNVIVQERVVQVPIQDEMEHRQGMEDNHTEKKDKGRAEGVQEKTKGVEAETNEEDKAETVAVASPAGEWDEIVDEEMTDLGAILETVMGRQWFQLFVQRQVDAEMVRKRWGTTVLEIFQVNRDMMDMAEDQEKHGVGPRAMEMRMGDGDVNVRHMSEDDSSAESSGAKVFPKREVVAGRREADEDADVEADRLVAPDEHAREEMKHHVDTATVGGEESRASNGTCGEARDGQHDEETQQVLQDTQLELMDVEGDSAGEPMAAGTTSSTEREGEDSFGAGKVQTDLQGWLK